MGSLVLVHLFVAAHIVHWKLAGKTLAPLELNELMYTLEAGIVTAGFLFMVAVVISVAIFGRFFCSWGCHILALQDLCSWLMQKAGIRPRMVRTRALALVPMGAMLYMFVWPQIKFVLMDFPRPVLHVTDDSSGWASFITDDFWRNLPAPGIALLTFAICGFGFVYFMGHRSFCRYGCPYGAIFALVDRFSPGQIAQVGDCSACGLCSAACQSDIRVHEELAAYGQVVNSACLKDLDCLAACPGNAIGFRFRRPSILVRNKDTSVKRKASSFSLVEEFVLAIVFIPLVFVFRGLYGLVPFLLALALAAMTAYAGVLTTRLFYRDSVKFVRQRLKVSGRLRRSGGVFAVASCLWWALVFHSAFVRMETWRGMQAVEGIEQLQDIGAIEKGERALRHAIGWGLLPVPGVATGLGQLVARRGILLAENGDLSSAARVLQEAVVRLPNSGPLRFNLARVLSATGQLEASRLHGEVAVELMPADVEAANNLGYVLMELGQGPAAIVQFERAILLDGSFAHAHFNLGRLRYEAGSFEEAQEKFRRAAQLDAQYAEWWRANEQEMFDGAR
jgi:tetratricopeptide (TPR) repeat protein